MGCIGSRRLSKLHFSSLSYCGLEGGWGEGCRGGAGMGRMGGSNRSEGLCMGAVCLIFCALSKQAADALVTEAVCTVYRLDVRENLC